MMLFRNLFITAAVVIGLTGNNFASASPIGPLWHYVMAEDAPSSLATAPAEPTPAAFPVEAIPSPVLETPAVSPTPEVISHPESETPAAIDLGYDAGDMTNSIAVPQTTPTALPVLANSAGHKYSPRAAGATIAFCTGLLYFVL